MSALRLNVTSPMFVHAGEVLVGEILKHNQGREAVSEYAYGLTVAEVETERNDTGRVISWTFITPAGLRTVAHPVDARLLVITHGLSEQ